MTHHTTNDEVREVVELVTSAMLQGTSEPSARPAPSEIGTDELWTARVRITGTFNGAVSLVCTRSFARRAVRRMTRSPATEPVTDDDARDALAELANVIAGNVKALLQVVEEPNHLSLPTVGEPVDRECEVICESWVRVGDHVSDRLGVFVAETIT